MALSPVLREQVQQIEEEKYDRFLDEELLKTKALIYAIGCIENLPKSFYEHSEMFKMRELVREMGDYQIANGLFFAERHFGRQIDLWADLLDQEEYLRSRQIRQIVCRIEKTNELSPVAA